MCLAPGLTELILGNTLKDVFFCIMTLNTTFSSKQLAYQHVLPSFSREPQTPIANEL